MKRNLTPALRYSSKSGFLVEENFLVTCEVIDGQFKYHGLYWAITFPSMNMLTLLQGVAIG